MVTHFVATTFHPGHDPGNLRAVLPQYAADNQWLAVHLAQFAGLSLSAVALVALARRLIGAGGRGGALARLGLLTVVVTVAVYAVNQAIDGVGAKFAADSYVAAAPADKPSALLVADAIRHLELGTASFFELTLVTYLTGLWILALALALWRSTTRQTPDQGLRATPP